MSAQKLLISLYFNELQRKFITPPFLDQPLFLDQPPSAFYPFLQKVLKSPSISAKFGRHQPPFRKGNPSYALLWFIATHYTRVEVVKESLDLRGKYPNANKGRIGFWWMQLKDQLHLSYTEKSRWYCSLNAWKVQL